MKKLLVIVMAMALVLVGSVMGAEDTSTATVTVNELLSVTISNDPVAFPSMDPDTGPTAANVGGGYPLTATIGSESNVDAKVETKAGSADFDAGGGKTFPVSNMEWSDTAAGTYADYSNTIAGIVCASVSAGDPCNIYHQLTIPANQAPGAYSVGITITATSV